MKTLPINLFIFSFFSLIAIGSSYSLSVDAGYFVRPSVLNPLDFNSLGSLALTQVDGPYIIETNGDPVLRDPGNNVLFTGLTVPQTDPLGYNLADSTLKCIPFMRLVPPSNYPLNLLVFQSLMFSLGGYLNRIPLHQPPP
ncbi:hypothetical protein ACL7TT_15110, partial [Microbulbifer sp. 2304DJ12-6]|uniref:hypothetical protein n=1 Tax=Microbulbifer sp. 2304DJ12-6 TaxID=3233340 RepID=UPI0039AF9719